MSESNIFLKVPVSKEIVDRFNNYVTMTGIDATYALEWAINRLTMLHQPDEGYPKKGVIVYSENNKSPCWVLGEKIDKYSGIKLYRVGRGTDVNFIRADQIQILDNE